MLIGIVVRSVTSKKSCALDGSPSCERNARQAMENRFEIRDSVDSAILTKVKNNVFLLVASCQLFSL